MKHLHIHPATGVQLEALWEDPPQALLLAGPEGVGKKTIAQEWAAHLTPLVNILTLEPDEKGTISIDAVRGLYQLTRAKQQHLQVIIVDHAEAMGIEAQNAFLKLLEEPRQGVTFILTTVNGNDLLPTIASRVQQVNVQRLSGTALKSLIPADVPAQETSQLLFMADGRPATLHVLLQDPALFARHRELMQKAKSLLAASEYERLGAINELVKDRKELLFVLEAMAHMIKLQLARQPEPALLAFAEAINVCLARLSTHGNPRAQLTHLFTAAHLV